MKAKEIKDLRKVLGLTGADLAALVGVNPSSVHRWENDEGSIDPGSDSILQVIAVCLDNKKSKKARAEFIASVTRALAVGGRLKGLHVVLCDHFEGADA